ncbi:MAG: leucyl/phenylalanyl-tRNA--protein transferase [Spirochaetaceae bacterium]|jgi:leucyl/phenylalanyl-tRNA--protein transferase|nr:leucyl/phenylalanyl-tRNA--protein transferase [Spirochaetaceae bacterium]
MSSPYLSADEFIRFPDPSEAIGDVVAFNGNLSPGMLISAYRQGIFPWYNEGEPILWQSPDPRFVLFPEKLHVSQSMRRILASGVYDIRFNTAFPRVIRNCAEIPRKGQDGTWLTKDMIDAYGEMHRLGYVHSAEAWQDDTLVGGCYGVLLGPHGQRLALDGDSGGVFFGESMFSHKPNASKAAFLTLAQKLFAQNIAFIDCQVWTAHLESLGGESLSRNAYLELLFSHLGRP